MCNAGNVIRVPHFPSSRPRGRPSLQAPTSQPSILNHHTAKPHLPRHKYPIHKRTHCSEKKRGEKEADKSNRHKMTGAKYNETYKKVSAMGEKLKAAGKQGPSNDEQLHVRFTHNLHLLLRTGNGGRKSGREEYIANTRISSCTRTPK